MHFVAGSEVCEATRFLSHFQANTVLDYLSLHEREHMEVKVKQLQMVSCVFGQANRTASMVRGLWQNNPAIIIMACVRLTCDEADAVSTLQTKCLDSDQWYIL